MQKLSYFFFLPQRSFIIPSINRVIIMVCVFGSNNDNQVNRVRKCQVTLTTRLNNLSFCDIVGFYVPVILENTIAKRYLIFE